MLHSLRLYFLLMHYAGSDVAFSFLSIKYYFFVSYWGQILKHTVGVIYFIQQFDIWNPLLFY